MFRVADHLKLRSRSADQQVFVSLEMSLCLKFNNLEKQPECKNGTIKTAVKFKLFSKVEDNKGRFKQFFNL